MRRIPIAAAAFGAVLFLSLAGTAVADDATDGGALVKKACSTCHATVTPSAPRQGPSLVGVFGRKACSVADFKYSPGFVASCKDVVWDEASLDRWLTNPQAMLPGAVMLYKQANPDKRRAIIAFLKTLQ
jgi:cytochrome c